MSRVTRLNESRHTCERVVSNVGLYLFCSAFSRTDVHESYETCMFVTCSWRGLAFGLVMLVTCHEHYTTCLHVTCICFGSFRVGPDCPVPSREVEIWHDNKFLTKEWCTQYAYQSLAVPSRQPLNQNLPMCVVLSTKELQYRLVSPWIRTRECVL